MHDHRRGLAAFLGAASMFLLAAPGSAQAPSGTIQIPTMAMPDTQNQAPGLPAAPPPPSEPKANAPAAQAAPPTTQATPPDVTLAPSPAAPPAAPAPAAAPAATPPATTPAPTAAPASPQPAPAPAANAAPQAPAKAKAAKAPTKAKTAARRKLALKLAAAHDPRAIVESIYKVSAGEDGDYSGPSAFGDKRVRNLYFSKDLLSALKAGEAKSSKTHETLFNFDPITNSQQPDVESLDIAVESQKANRMVVFARVKSPTDSSLVHYDFIKEGDAWKLDNIRGEIQGQSGQWSVRDIIGNAIQQP